MTRTILHVDMDAFFVSVEVRRRPELRGLPVIVGGTGERGVVAAASYEARRFGVHSAMPSVRARRLCPQAVVLPGDHAAYEEVSHHVHAVFASFTPLVEGIALDEAFLDVTGATRLFGTGVEIAGAIRRRIAAELELSCAVGVAASKFIAKMASKAAKPRVAPTGVTPGPGIVEVRPGEELAFLHPRPVQALWGVGPATLERLQRLGITTIGDLTTLPESAVLSALGRSHGQHLLELAHGHDDRPVVPERAAKSIGHEQTFVHDLDDHATLGREIVRMADAVAARMRAHGVVGRTVTIKVRFGTFETITRGATLPEPIDTAPAVATAARDLLAAVEVGQGVRMLGVSVTNLAEAGPRQLALGVEPAVDWSDASRAVDDIRRRFGSAAIGPASLVDAERGLRVARRGEQAWGPDHHGPSPPRN
jgi:DNA polymerase-4